MVGQSGLRLGQAAEDAVDEGDRCDIEIDVEAAPEIMVDRVDGDV